VPARGTFIAGEAGPLAVVSWQPPAGVATRFAVLHLPAFGDEMNKSRRMVALQAQALAGAGGATHVLDPRGTGDSAGDFGDATWAGWCADAVAAAAFARKSVPDDVPVVLWGCRLGALLAADLAVSGSLGPDLLLLWQPVMSAKTFFSQLFRIVAAQQWAGREGAGSVRDALAAGRSVEIGGYAVRPELVRDAEAVDLASAPPPRCPVVVRETAPSPAGVSPAVAKVLTSWTTGGAVVDADVAEGPSFWATQEIEVAPSLVASTTNAVLSALGRAAERR